MSIDEEISFEDFNQNPRPTRQPYKCSKCGNIFHTRDIYLKHKETCKGKTLKQHTQYEIEREKQLENSLRAFKKQHNIK